jgi:hypothetical protein
VFRAIMTLKDACPEPVSVSATRTEWRRLKSSCATAKRWSVE